MTKLLVIYSIQNEKARNSFETAIHTMDKDCVIVTQNHAYAFRSDKTPKELFHILGDTKIKCPPDDFVIFELGKFHSGFLPEGWTEFLAK